MNRILSIVGLVVAMALPAAAQNHKAQSFLSSGIGAVYVTNLVSITNLLAAGGVGTNVAGTTYTNMGTRVVVSAAGAGAAVNLLSDVGLWARRDGQLATTLLGITNGATVVYPVEWSDATISVTWTAGSGANTAVQFAVVPVWDGVNASTQSGDLWTFAFTATASTTSTFSTNVPMTRFAGAKSLRLLRIYNADGDANGHVIITDVKLNGFVP